MYLVCPPHHHHHPATSPLLYCRVASSQKYFEHTHNTCVYVCVCSYVKFSANFHIDTHTHTNAYLCVATFPNLKPFFVLPVSELFSTNCVWFLLFKSASTCRVRMFMQIICICFPFFDTYVCVCTSDVCHIQKVACAIVIITDINNSLFQKRFFPW